MPGKIVEFVTLLEEGARKRHHHQSEKGKIIYYVVQLEVRIKGEWKQVIRYDCSHGFAHVDVYKSDGTKFMHAINLKNEDALTYADADINENWKRYLKDFLK